MEGRREQKFARLKAKLKASLEQENYYEAHQIYRTLYFRLLGQKLHDDLEDILYDGAVRMFAANQSGSGADLARMYLENLTAAEAAATEERLTRTAELHAKVPDSLPDKERITAEAVKWSSAGGANPAGHPRLHQLLGFELWRQRRYPEARVHLFNSLDGSGLGQMMAEFQTDRGLGSEVDLFVAATVLQLLARKKHHRVAAAALESYCDAHPKIKKGPPFKFPLINFCWLLLLAIEQKKSLQAFTVLVDKYGPSLKRDISFSGYLDKVGQLYFGVPAPQKTRQGGMFGGILDSLMDALNEDDDETTAGTSRTTMKDADLD